MTAPMNLREYFAAAGSPYTKDDAEVIGPQIEALAEEGDVSPERIRDVARSTNSPLHRFIDWDKDVAADKWQLHQADTMMRAIRVRVVEDDRPRVVPAYKVARAQPKSVLPRGHNVLHGASAAAVQKAKEAFDELTGWRARYAPFVMVWKDFAQAFQGVNNQIGEAEDVVDTSGLDDRTDEALTDLQTALATLAAWRAKHAATAAAWSALSEQAEFLCEAVDEALSTYSTKLMAAERKCLRCSEPFQSGGVGNRLCPKCAGKLAVGTAHLS